MLEKVSKYDQKVPQSYTTVKPMAPQSHEAREVLIFSAI